ncbi:hypothetical protein [Yinghuangia soli]|uniref:Uncharacterized protein n=1 Tax=Yinghuangia soli TaxID=2908204 RepID=A0AA41PWU2_9ACTN|nr:hypothetical protein [Yinghuangia soli]MCF2526299.1 hypothetical protein [Yinghuangia soli]
MPVGLFVSGAVRRRRAGRLLPGLAGVAALAVLTAGCGGGDAKDAKDVKPSGSAAAPAGAQGAVAQITKAEVKALLDAQTQALKAGDEAAFLAAYEGADAAVLAERRRTFANLRLVPFDSVEFTAPTAPEVKAAEGSGPAELEVPVVFMHRITGIDAVPVGEGYRYRIVRTAPGGPLRIAHAEGGGGSVGYPAPWDQGEMAVVARPHVLLLAAKADQAKAEGWADTAETAAAAGVATWRGPAGTASRFLVYGTAERIGYAKMFGGEKGTRNASTDCRLATAAGAATPCSLAVAGSPRLTVDFSGKPAATAEALVGPLTDALLSPLCKETCKGRASWVLEGYSLVQDWGLGNDDGMVRGTVQELFKQREFTGKLPSLDRSGSSVLSLDADGYAAALAMHRLTEKFGAEKAHTVAAGAFGTPDDAAFAALFRSTTGTDLAAFEKDWAAWVRAKA